MRAPPCLHGGLAVRLAALVFGLFLFATGVVALLESRLGLSPWDVLHQGIAKHSPLSFGEANIVVGVVVLTLAWRLGARIGIATVANAVLIGVFIDRATSIGWVRGLAHDALGVRVALVVVGIVLIGLGSGFYLGANLGAGPRDSLMVAGAARTRFRIGFVRAAIELSALAAGFALGGKVGVGTVAFAVLVGPAVEAAFWAMVRTGLAEPSAGVRLPDMSGPAEVLGSSEVARAGGPTALP